MELKVACRAYMFLYVIFLMSGSQSGMSQLDFTLSLRERGCALLPDIQVSMSQCRSVAGLYKVLPLIKLICFN